MGRDRRHPHENMRNMYEDSVVVVVVVGAWERERQWASALTYEGLCS